MYYCANPGTPSGGPRDLRPPRLVSSKPEAGSTGFSGNMVTLVFDENIQTKDIESKFVVSPPMAIKPKIDAHGNMIRIRFDSDTILAPSTTYTFDFADCISDLNENNVLDGFTFTFSTGESTDSMMISGNIFDAQTIAPSKGIYVILQQDLADSAFYSVPPIRIAKTDDYGRFAIKNVPADRKYRVYALDDQNRNFFFDQPIETIGWLDNIITPSSEIRQINDSIRIDSLSTSIDTAEWVFRPIIRDTLVYTPDSLIFYTFLEDSYDQYITKDERNKKDVINLIFNKPMSRKPIITFPGQDESIQHSVNEFSIANDTCTIWITDSLMYNSDSIIVAVNYLVLDSLKQFTEKIDTLDFWFFSQGEKNTKDKKKNKKNKPEKVIVPTLKVSVPQSIGVFGTLGITSTTPFRDFDWTGIRLSHKADTIFEPITFTQIDDTINLRHKSIKATWIPGDEYRLTIDSASMSDIYGLYCDSLSFKFNITKLDKYGTLYINIDSVPKNGLLQLLSGKDNTVARQLYIPSNGKAAFKYIKPGTYKLRILIDSNRNGKWDTGSYEKKMQPEQCIYYMENISVRANWDIKIDFETKKFDPDKYARKFLVKINNNNNKKRY